MPKHRRSTRFLYSRRRWMVLAALAAILLVAIFTGALGAFYGWLIGWSSNDKPWTHILRDHPWIFWVVLQ